MCLSTEWIEYLIIRLIILCAVVAVIRLIVPWAMAQLGVAGGLVASVVNIVLWAIVAIVVVVICFALLNCLGTGFIFHR
jgi:uncharacterized membrane protein